MTSRPKARKDEPQKSGTELAAVLEAYLAGHDDVAVLEDGKAVFDLKTAKFAIKVDDGRCQFQLWDEVRHLARTVVAAEMRAGTLRLATERLGQRQTKLLQLVPQTQKPQRGMRDQARSQARTAYLKLLERVLTRAFPEEKADGFRTSMDLEKSFGPAYARGWLVRGKSAWAVVGVNADESATTIDGVLTAGILWLHHCREQLVGQKQFVGLKVILPRGCGLLTASRMAWLNSDAARWEMWDLEAATEEMTERDLDDRGNLRTRLIHHPNAVTGAERFANAVSQVKALVPDGEWDRVETRLRGPAEMAFLLHGLEFARARFTVSGTRFTPTLEITVGEGGQRLESASSEELAAKVAELFARRRAVDSAMFARRSMVEARLSRRIGGPSTQPAHAKMQGRVRPQAEQRQVQHDPLYRAAPERWLESVLRKDLTTLTRGLALTKEAAPRGDDFGNRVEPPREAGSVIPRLDGRHVYTQVPAIAGASDRGMLDLLGVTADGRLAVIELKADEDMHFALQGLDYWIRVRHHLQQQDPASGMGEFQRHGYFVDVELSSLAPRLYLVAPALRIHPATEIVLRYLSRRVEWNLLALDERWRSQVRVIWRRQSGRL